MAKTSRLRWLRIFDQGLRHAINYREIASTWPCEYH